MMNYCAKENTKDCCDDTLRREGTSVESISAKVNEAMCYLKDLMAMMNETSVAVFGDECPPSAEAISEARCLIDAVSAVRAQAHHALKCFDQMRGKLVG